MLKYNITFIEDTGIDNNYWFDISTQSFSDSDSYIFAISNEKASKNLMELNKLKAGYMNNLTKEQKQAMLDSFGKIVIEEVRDGALKVSMDIVQQNTVNSIKLKQYNILSTLSDEQREAVCDLLSETITDTIYRFLEMFEENMNKMKISLIKDENEYDMTKISEKMGSEIVCFEDNGWIQRFSEIGRFIL